MTLVIVVAPFMAQLEYRPKSDPTTSGWSSPAPLTFETAKPRTTAQSSGTFFTFAAAISAYFAFLLLQRSDSSTLLTSFISRYSLSELQRWQV
jgi:hypothetical protein